MLNTRKYGKIYGKINKTKYWKGGDFPLSFHSNDTATVQAATAQALIHQQRANSFGGSISKKRKTKTKRKITNKRRIKRK